MNEKLRWLLETWFGDSFHCSMIEKAINSKSISLDEFITGFDSLRNAQWDNKDDFDTFVPDEFKTLYDSQQLITSKTSIMKTNMTGTKLWVLQTSETFGYGLETNAMIFSSKEKAQKALDDYANKCYDSLTSIDGWVVDSKTDNNGSYTKGWCAYKEGHFEQSHSCAEILERDVL